jgi:hypothetical protein
MKCCHYHSIQLCTVRNSGPSFKETQLDLRLSWGSVPRSYNSNIEHVGIDPVSILCFCGE